MIPIKSNFEKWQECQRRAMRKTISNRNRKNLEKLKAGTLYKKESFKGYDTKNCVVWEEGKKPKKKNKKTERQILIKEIDDVWSLIIRISCQCELCGGRGELKDFDAHHICSRKHMSTRWYLKNGACLHKGCHRFKVHMDTLSSSILIDKLKKKRGKVWWNNLIKKSEKTKKYSIPQLRLKLIELKSILTKLKNEKENNL